MDEKPNQSIEDLLVELYELDPDLKTHEAVLPELINTLRSHQPEVTIDATFLANLRASLLSHTPTPTKTKSTPIVSPYLWWISPLLPVGVALFLFVTLAPHTPTNPTIMHEEAGSEPDVFLDAPRSPEAPEMKLFEASMMPESDEGMMLQALDQPSLVVEPPLANSSSVSVTNLSLPTDGWIVVHEDAGGTLGTILHYSRLTAGTHTELTLSLTRPLTYPEMVTIVLYTDSQYPDFATSTEVIQNDPQTGAPLMVTVPVISELEQGLTP
jgi:hypothetical protein